MRRVRVWKKERFGPFWTYLSGRGQFGPCSKPKKNKPPFSTVSVPVFWTTPCTALDVRIVFQIQDPSADDWQPILLPQRPTSDTRPLGHIALDQSDNGPFPAPSVDTQYTHLFHSATLCRQPHTLASRCYHQPQKPTRRFHPRYAAIGKRPSADGRLVMAPLRSSKGTRRMSSSSPTPSRNPSTSGLSVS